MLSRTKRALAPTVFAVKRTYAVKPTTERSNDDSMMQFKPISVLERHWKKSQREQKLLGLFQLIQPYKVGPDFLKFVNNYTNKELKESKLLPNNVDIDFASQMSSDTIVATESQLQAVFGTDYKEIMSDFFTHKPELSSQAMETYLKLNAEEYAKIQLERSDKLLDLCLSVYKKNKKQ